jgi:hypothetical protein
MKLAPHSFLSVLLFAFLINIDVAGAAVDRSVSTSRQFIVYGTTTELRGAIAALAEKTKKNLLGILQQRDDWKTPVIVNLQFPQANIPDVPLSGRYFSQTGSGLKFQLDLTIEANLDVTALQRDLSWAILLEMMYRRQPDLPAGTSYVQPPEWLIEGLLTAQPGQSRAEISEALAPALAHDNVVTLEAFLRQKQGLLDSTGQLLYRAYSFVLLQLLLDDAAGPMRLAAYIANLSHASNDPLADLKERFPTLAGAGDVDALWKSKVAAAGSAHDYELLTCAETDRQLEDLLAGGPRDATDTQRPAQLETLLSKKVSPEKAAELRRLSQGLMLLTTRSNPVLRPVVREYQIIVERMAANKRRGLETRLAKAKSTRARIVARMSDIDDYMNWFEATKSSTRSGAFASYLRAVEKSNEPQPRRRDPLSVYLDSLEAKF